MSIVVCNTIESSTTVTNVDLACVQQCAIDLRLDRVWMMSGPFLIDEERKSHRNKVEIKPGDDGYINLVNGSYEVAFCHEADLGKYEAGIIVTRSTLNRNGVVVTSGMCDPKFNGNLGGLLIVTGGSFKVKPKTRIAQFVVFDVKNPTGEYDGDYVLDRNKKPKLMEQQYYTIDRQ